MRPWTERDALNDAPLRAGMVPELLRVRGSCTARLSASAKGWVAGTRRVPRVRGRPFRPPKGKPVRPCGPSSKRELASAMCYAANAAPHIAGSPPARPAFAAAPLKRDNSQGPISPGRGWGEDPRTRPPVQGARRERLGFGRTFFPCLPETTEWTGSARPVAGARRISERRGGASGVRLYGEGWRGTRRGSPACGG